MMKCELDTLLNQITMWLTIKCQCLESENRYRICSKRAPGSEYINFSHDGPICKHTHNPNDVMCMNCKQWSHDQDHCYREGGGMAGQGPCAKVATVAKSGKGLLKTGLAVFLDTLGDDKLSCAPMEECSDNLVELVANSLMTLLDIGATSHLVKGCEFFWDYNKKEAQKVKTANLGILQTQASETCVAHFTYNRVSMRVKLRNCLHAPNEFVNLLSIGWFIIGKVSCMFKKGCIILSMARKSFRYGPMVNKLFVLEVEFLKPPIGSSAAPSASLIMEWMSSAEVALFAKVPETLELWHYCMGHPGEPATIVLLKSTIGASFPPGKSLTRCEPCIFGKQACLLAPTPTSTLCSMELPDLIHVDICSLFLVGTPHGKLYFVLFLDDTFSIVNLQNLAL